MRQNDFLFYLILMLPSKGNNYDEIVNNNKNNKKVRTAEGVLMQLPITDAFQHSFLI